MKQAILGGMAEELGHQGRWGEGCPGVPTLSEVWGLLLLPLHSGLILADTFQLPRALPGSLGWHPWPGAQPQSCILTTGSGGDRVVPAGRLTSSMWGASRRVGDTRSL